MRRTDGSPVTRLGEGWPADLSADGKWVLAVLQSRPPQLVIYPTGAGETVRLERGDLESYATAQWFRDGKSVLISGNKPGKGMRSYVQEISGGPRAVTPEADGRSVLVYRRAEIPCRLGRVLLDTGLAPTDRAGLLSLRGVFVTDDLRSYAYTAYHQVSSLFVSEARPTAGAR
jgi:hypothetical protein